MITLKRYHIIFTLILIGITSNAQLTVPFKKRFEKFVKGDMIVIANSTTNRVDLSGSTTSEYNNLDRSALHNDEFEIRYIDIDNDETTFSSSLARFSPANPEQKKVIYAGLYWSATYPYEAGEMKKEGKFKVTDAHRNAVNEIKIKLPGEQHYRSITGEILFDGFAKKEFQECAPYAAYADITPLITQLNNPFGDYIVANVRATQGKISGGVASGWTLFLVYEDPSMSGRYITSFDGFAGVTNQSTNIEIEGFKTVTEGAIKAKLAFAALEGDSNMSGDQLLFKTGETNSFCNLQNASRKPTNFFNSTISSFSENCNRYPACQNTLGYDAGIIEIDNPNNSIITHNSNAATLRLKSVGDRFYMFFSAFNIEVSEQEFFTPNTQEATVVNTSQPHITKRTEDEFGLDSQPAYHYSSIQDETDIKYVEIENVAAGYYIIANVFEQNFYLNNFLEHLKNQSLSADSFYNPNNHYNYVYLAKTNDKEEAIQLYNSGVNHTYNNHIWILSVNCRQEPLLTSDE